MASSSSKYFPLRWESTGDQWWFASPIDWAAANGHYDVVIELLHIDTNLLIKLTSLPRIHRLETVWDDDQENFKDVAKNRAKVARKLLQECETKKGKNSLIRAGYGGWLLYTAASAGDVSFVKELLERDPLLVFGEGEYGVTDMFYAAARSKNCEVFKVLFDCSVSCKEEGNEVSLVFKKEMMNRAVHAAARGGNLEILREFLGNNGDVLDYKDAQGSNVLHTAASRGQVEVVKDLISSYNIINSVDNQGNTALQIAAFHGHLPVVELLISSSPSSPSSTNNYGDTFLHMAVSGFRTPSFRQLDLQIKLMKRLLDNNLTNISDIINLQNNNGRTALHLAVIDNIQSEIVELLMGVKYINLNIRDSDGNTPLDILKQRPRSASSEILIKRFISAGANSEDRVARSALVSHLRMHGIEGSPGTSFDIPDGEIFLYTGNEYSGEIERTESNSSNYKKFGSLKKATSHLKILLGKKEADESYSETRPIPLRQQFSRLSSLPNNKRIMALPLQGNYLPSPLAKKKFSSGLSQGVLQVNRKSYFGSPSSAISESSWSSPVSKGKGIDFEDGSVGCSSLNKSPEVGSSKMKRKHGSFKLKLMNNYFCFGAQGLAMDNNTAPAPAPAPQEYKNQESLVV